MARKKCRDCSFCTESFLKSMFLGPFRMLIAPFRAIAWSLRSRCPECGHPLKFHSRDAQGRFKD
jgi:hypothetical protein